MSASALFVAGLLLWFLLPNRLAAWRTGVRRPRLRGGEQGSLVCGWQIVC